MTASALAFDPGPDREAERARLPRSRRLIGPLAFALGLGVAVGALHLRDPHASGAWGYCPTLLITGLPCPLCGGLRAVNDLSNGQIGDAISSNALFVLSIPLFVLWWVRVVRDRWRGVARQWVEPLRRRGVMPLAVGAMVVFGIVRNLPFAHALAP